MIKIKQWWNQINCLHFWIEGLPVDLRYGKGYKYAYDCDVCKKHIERWDRPISGMPDPIFNKKSSVYEISPPVIYIDRSNF